MYFHAGQDFVLNTRDVIGIFDLDTAGASKRTQEYFRHMESEGAVADLCAAVFMVGCGFAVGFGDDFFCHDCLRKIRNEELGIT